MSECTPSRKRRRGSDRWDTWLSLLKNSKSRPPPAQPYKVMSLYSSSLFLALVVACFGHCGLATIWNNSKKTFLSDWMLNDCFNHVTVSELLFLSVILIVLFHQNKCVFSLLKPCWQCDASLTSPRGSAGNNTTKASDSSLFPSLYCLCLELNWTNPRVYCLDSQQWMVDSWHNFFQKRNMH